MKFAIFTHVEHFVEDNVYFAYAPYVREMNVWLNYVDEVIVVAPIDLEKRTAIHTSYVHNNIKLISIPKVDLLRFKSIFRAIIDTPKVSWKIYKAMRDADHIHLRCPGNIGLLGCIIQALFPKKSKTAKYAGNWDPKSKQPLSYQIQKWILSNTTLTKNIQTLVYGEWNDSSSNIKPFFTATYREEDKVVTTPRLLDSTVHFLFVGTLSPGKRPLYALKIVEMLSRLGYPVSLQFFGEGIERKSLQEYCDLNQLNAIVEFKGNQTERVVREAYKRSHFLLLPSQSEGWPKVVAESMFWGCLPIATQVSCVGNMLDYGKRGLLLKMDLDVDVKMISAIVNSQSEYNSKVEESICWSRKYTIDLFENEIRALLHS